MKSSIIKRTNKKSTKRNFSLLELLVVVGIMALIGGSMIAAYDGLIAQAAKSTATNSIASLQNSIRSYNVTEKALPNNVESLLAAEPSSPAYDAASLDSTAVAVTNVEAAGHLGSKLAGKFGVFDLTVNQLGALKNAGIDSVRYLDLKGNNETVEDLSILAADGVAATQVGALSEISIPQHAFEAPRPGDGRNRGRGFALDMSDAGFAASASGAQFMVWSGQDPASPVAKYDNVKVGASPTAILVGLGIGNASSLVSADDDKSGGVGNVRLDNAPFYGDVAKNEYNHYIMLVDVAQDPAKMICIVDPRGDFLDEEFAESTGQKQ
jgi:type II secretory pathway pseudopilin PulG